MLGEDEDEEGVNGICWVGLSGFEIGGFWFGLFVGFERHHYYFYFYHNYPKIQQAFGTTFWKEQRLAVRTQCLKK